MFDAGVQEQDFATGVEWFLSGVLQSPDFWYQLSRLQAGEQAGQLVAIPPYELASRLSYFIWDSMPDDPLCIAAASTSDLADATKLQSQLDRMIEGSAIPARRHGFLQIVARPQRFQRGRARRHGVHDRRCQRAADVSAHERHPALPRCHARQCLGPVLRHVVLPQWRTTHVLRPVRHRHRHHIHRDRHGER